MTSNAPGMAKMLVWKNKIKEELTEGFMEARRINVSLRENALRVIAVNKHVSGPHRKSLRTIN